MRRLWVTMGIASLGACAFDTGGAGSGGTESDTTDSSGGTSAGPTSGVTITTSTSADSTSSTTGTTTTDATTVDSTSDDATTRNPTTGTDATSGDDTTTGNDTTTGDPCANPPQVEELLWAVPDATLQDMGTFTSSLLPDGPNGPIEYAVSTASGVGTVTWPFGAQCDGQLFFWGLVYDDEPGIGPGSADSYWFAFDEVPPADDDTAQTYVYGCTTGGLDAGWSWQPLNNTVDAQNGMCIFDPIMPMTLTAGSHELVMLNRENQGFGSDVAAIAALVISSDENFDPSTLYDPSP